MPRSIISLLASVFALGFLLGGPAEGKQSDHQKNTTSRSNLYFGYKVEQRYGTAKVNGGEQAGLGSGSWKGTVPHALIGMSIEQFVHLKLSHSFLDLNQSGGGQLQDIDGSSTAAEVGLVFQAPVVNLELGVGISAGKVTYRSPEHTQTFSMVGRYSEVGLEHALSKRFSLVLTGRMGVERFEGGSDKSPIGDMTLDSRSVLVGFRLWK